jgi:hypothetical protein
MCTAEALPILGSPSEKAEPVELKVLGKAESLLTRVISQKLAPVKSKDNTRCDIADYINSAEKVSLGSYVTPSVAQLVDT